MVVFQAWPSGALTPRLQFVCFDSHGNQLGSPQAVTERATRQDSQVVIPSGQGSAVAAWADVDGSVNGQDVWTQRIGCCPPLPEGISPVPIFPCGIVEWPGLPFGQLPISFPCGDRASQYGVIPLSRLPLPVPGLDVPGCLVNRATPPPDWMRITFLGLPPAVHVELRTSEGRLAAESVALEGPRDTIAGRAITFRPPGREDEFLVFRHIGAPIEESAIVVRVATRWGDGHPPSLPRLAGDRPRSEQKSDRSPML